MNYYIKSCCLLGDLSSSGEFPLQLPVEMTLEPGGCVT
jgi:hypothetical protein